MSDTFTSTTSQSWFSRIGGSIKGILVGIILVIVSVPFLFWNEGRAVETYKTLLEGAGLVVSVEADRVDPANEGKLVHVTGLATTGETLSDPLIEVAVNAIRLSRNVEMYQWIERTESVTREKLGGGTETVTTYKYEKGWADKPIDSTRFEHPDNHINPAVMPTQNEGWQAQDVTLGSFRLSSRLTAAIGGEADHFLDADTAIPAALGEAAKWHQGGIYIGDPSAPAVGDIRVRFQVVKPAEVSVIARQVKDSFEPYRAAAGGSIEMLEMGTVSADTMFDAAQSRNTVLTWVLRFVGFVIMLIGFRMIFSILRVLASIVPLFGQIVGLGVSLVAAVLAASLSLVTIALAWVYYRPLLGISLLVIAAALTAFVFYRVRKAEVVVEGDGEPFPTAPAAAGSAGTPPEDHPPQAPSSTW